MRLLHSFVNLSEAYVSSEAFELVVAAVLKFPPSIKYADALTFFELLLHKLPYIATRNLSLQLWHEFEEHVFLPVLSKMQAHDLARLLEISLIVRHTS